jgi:hypothetical protein
MDNQNLINLVMAAGQLVNMWRRGNIVNLAAYEAELWAAIDNLEGSESVNLEYLRMKNGESTSV